MTKTLPNFLIAGASRSGTTTLYNSLRQHPDIFMPENKELRFFDQTSNYSRGMEYYKKKFKKHNNESAIGEASAPYFYNGITFDEQGNYRWNKKDDPPTRIKEKLPNAKIIITLRNPIDRAYSQYWKNVRQGREKTHPFRKAVENEQKEKRTPKNSGLCWVYKNKYPIHIKKWFSLFDRNQIKVIIFEEWTKDITNTLQNICKFLEVDPSFDSYPTKKKNVSRVPRSLMINDIYHEYLSSYFIGKVINKLNMKKGYPPMKPATKKYMLNTMKPYIKELEDVLGRNLNIWLEENK